MLTFDWNPPLKGWMKDYQFILIQSLEQLKEVIDKAIASKFCSFDLESTGLDTRVFKNVCKSHVVGYSISFEDKIGYYIPIRHTVETVSAKNLPVKETNAEIQRLLCAEGVSIVGHNWLKYDAELLFASENILILKPDGKVKYPYHDTYILARLANKKPSGLKYLAKTLLGKEMFELEDIVPKVMGIIDFSSISPQSGLIYASSDAILTRELFYHPEIQLPLKEQALVYNLETKLTGVVRKMERNKIKLDYEHCLKMDTDLLSRISSLEKDIYNIVSEKTNGQIKSFKLDSPDDVSHILFDIFDMNPKPEKGKKGNYSTDDEALEKLAPNYILAKKIQDYRTDTKFYRTYIRNMLLNVDEDGYLKFNFAQLRTDSGRFASPGRSDEGEGNDGYSGVNVQATPARYDITKPNVRKCISCEKDEVIAALDWSGVELRVAANMSKEPIWLDRFLKGDGDLHTSTAAIIYDIAEKDVTKEQRQTGKCVAPESLLFVNGQYTRIGDLHSGRDLDTFYDFEDKKVVKVNDANESLIKGFYSNGIGKRYLICHQKGILVCSGNHQLELADGSLVRAQDIISGMELPEVSLNLEPKDSVEKVSLNSIPKPNAQNMCFTTDLNEDLCYTLGVLVGDGGVGSSKNTCLTNIEGKEKYLDWQKTAIKSLESIVLSSYNHEDNNIENSILDNKNILFIFQELGLVGKDNKKKVSVPEYLLNSTRKNKMSFLAGLLDTMGIVSESGNLNMTTESWVLAQDLCVLLASCGIHYHVTNIFNKNIQKISFKIGIANKCSLLFKSLLKCSWKAEKIVKSKVNANVYFKNIVTKAIPLDEDLLVDISVDDPEHMYLVNGIRTHNTFNFQTVYGGGPGTLASTLDISFEDAKEKQEKYFGKLKGLHGWIKSRQIFAEKNKYCLTEFGRKRLLPDFDSDIPRIRSSGRRKAVNTPVQGCLSGDSRILLSGKGFVKIRDALSFRGSYWEGFKYITADCVYSGKKQKVVIKLYNGQEIICSPDHKFLTLDNNQNYLWKTIKEFNKKEQLVLSSEVSDYSYRSKLYEDIRLSEPEKKSISLNSIENDFELGLLLGRFALAGSLENISNSDNLVTWVVKESEYNILPQLKNIFYKLDPNFIEKRFKDRNQEITQISIYSQVLVKQMELLNLKKEIPDFIWSSKELLRGFLCSYFDYAGELLEDEIKVTLNNDYTLKNYAQEMQKALSLFDIQSQIYSYLDKISLQIKHFSNTDFINKIGFLNSQKKDVFCNQVNLIKPEILPKVECVENINITEEFIDMYDVVNCPEEKYMADGLIVHNSAADLLKLAMFAVDNYIEKYNLTDTIQMLLTMHDELVFRIKKDKVDLIYDIVKVMKLDDVVNKINWPVHLKVDCEIGSSWDIDYEYEDMLEFLKEIYNVTKVSWIYEPAQDYDKLLGELKSWKKKKKEEKNSKKEAQQKDTPAESNSGLDDFKKYGSVLKVETPKEVIEEKVNEEPTQELPKEESDLKILPEEIDKESIKRKEDNPIVSSTNVSVTASEISDAFTILKEVSLSDLPTSVYSKLKKSFYISEFERLQKGLPSEDDSEVEVTLIVHDPIDEAKKNLLGYLIESCKGNGKVKLFNSNKEELHEDWLKLDLIKFSIMSKIFNL